MNVNMCYTHNGARPAAYDHMKPYERLCSFIKGMVHIANQNVANLQREVALWDLPEARALFGDEQCNLQKLNSQAVLDAHLYEFNTYSKLEAQLGACTDCGGQGWYWVNVSQDESRRETCEKCQGCGKTLEAATKLMALNAQQAPAPKKQGVVDSIISTVGRKFK